MTKAFKALSAAVFSFLFVWGIEFLYDLRSGNSLFSNSVTAALLFGLAAYAAFRMLEMKTGRRTWVLAVLAAFVFGACMCLGHSLNYTETIWNQKTFAAFVFLVPFLTLLLRSFLHFLERQEREWQERVPERKCMLIYAGILLLVWLPTLLASWPGIYGYDAEFQLNQYFSGEFNSHHPVMHTLLVGSAMKLGLLLGGTPQAGAAVYTVLQMLTMAGIFGYVIYRLQKQGAPAWLMIGSMVFFGIHPAVSLSVLSSTKDTLFAGFMILTVLKLIELEEDPKKFWGSRKQVISLGVLFLLLMAFRNNAFHMLLVYAPFFLWAYRKYWKKALLVLCGTLCLYGGITGPGYDALGITKGDPREMYSVLMQTAARAYNLVNQDLTEEEKEGFRSVIAEEGLNSYLPRFADPVKAYFDGEKFTEEPGTFLKAWFSVGKRHTKIYVDAVLSNTLGYWYPGAMLPNNSGNHYIEYWANGNSADLAVEMRPMLPGLHSLYEKICNEAMHQHVPVLSFVLPVGTFLWVLIFGCICLIYRKRYGKLLILLPQVLYLATLFLGPVVCLRYVFPIIVCTPVTVGLMLKKEKQHG